ncbi:hypothetical protein PIB30_083237 [Stylosanthes scabra]|uniref:Aminotransferase-like plant mobile domain-containing protein n=1 Tax=Stylosanthes scabra TaxID=79078 RepID=A0ABU6VUA4_9FABA|nr:hypothetical protein [Stylosanthes scabra]
MTLLLSWAYHRIPACRPVGFEQRHFLVAERWIGYEPPRDREETKLRGWRRILNRLGITDVVWTPYADPLLQPIIPPWLVQSIGTWHVTIWIEAAHSVSASEHRRDAYSRRSLGQGEWYPDFLQGWYEMWRGRATHRLPLDLHPDLRPSRSYLEWYFQWANLVLVARGTSRTSLCSTFPLIFLFMISPLLSCINQRMATCQKYVHEEGVRSECATGEGAVPGGAGGRGQSRSRLRSHQFRSPQSRSRRFKSHLFRSHRFRSRRFRSS